MHRGGPPRYHATHARTDMATFSISLSGMNAAHTSLGDTAHDIANLDTSNFRRQQVQQASEPGAAGVTATPSPPTEPGDANETDFVGDLQVKNSSPADLTVLRKQDKMMGALLTISG
jgi:hypothetical protein